MGSVNVSVYHKSGSPASGVRVSGSVSAGGVTATVRTSRQGHANISWSSSRGLSKIFVNGKGHSGDYRSGQTYSFSI